MVRVDVHRRGRFVLHLLFLTYYMQQTLGFSPFLTGVAFFAVSGGTTVMSNLSTIVFMPRVGRKPLVGLGMLIASGVMVSLAELRAHTTYVDGCSARS